jgi:formylglycine-generating enzyme required for sulfatase activity
MSKLSSKNQFYQLHDFKEILPLSPNSIEMIAIVGGTFKMGSPKTELDRFDDESPQHRVKVSSFLMSKFPICRISWAVVADTMSQIEIPLSKSPSELKIVSPNSGLHPVTNINWFEAVEFCQRLSAYSRRTYRLPTEAEWEYACRASTTTPFYFGETISTDLANYRGTDDADLQWSGAYGLGTTGIYRAETTPVGSFPANQFGLYDMHGNVWEWCLDSWHDNYRGAPKDGSAWQSDDPAASRIVRGGAWSYIPRSCRSATRHDFAPIWQDNSVGFRVVGEIPQDS